MIKNAIIYRVSGLPGTIDALDKALAAQAYAPCTPGQALSWGFAPPRGHAHGALAEAIGGQWIARFVVETRGVPGEAVAKRAGEKAAKIEREAGRKPGKREMRDLREEAHAELLPHAFSRIKTVWAWIDRARGLLVIDAASQTTADAALACMVNAMPGGFSAASLQTNRYPLGCMTAWLTEDGGPPGDLYLGRACELRADGGDPARTRISGQDLTTPEVRKQVKRGLLPVSVELSNGRVRCTLTHVLQLRRIEILADARGDDGIESEEDVFDSTVALVTGELRALIDSLVDALGGEVGAA